MPTNPESNDSSYQFEAIVNAQIDPLFREFFKSVRDAQAALDSLNDPDINEVGVIMEQLNEEWRDHEWQEMPVRLSGKVRLAPSCTIDEINVVNFTEHHDAKYLDGDMFYEVAGEMFVSADFDIDQDPNEEGEYDEKPRIVFSFYEPEYYDEATLDDEIDSSGCLQMRIDEIEAAHFAEPSLEAAYQYIEYHHPEVFEQLEKKFSKPNTRSGRLRDLLRDTRIDLSDRASNDTLLRNYIERALYDRINFNEGMYAITTRGGVATFDGNDRRLESADQESRKKFNAHIARIKLVETEIDGCFELRLLVAQPEKDNDGLLSLIELTGPRIESIRSLRNVTKHFGACGIRLFEDINDIDNYLDAIYAPSDYDSVGGIETESGLEELVKMDDTLAGRVARIQRYNTERKSYEITLDDDFQKAKSFFMNASREKESQLKDGHSIEKTFEDIARDLHESSALDFNELRVGDTLLTRDAFGGIIFDGTTGQTIPLLHEGGELSGVYVGMYVMRFPDLASSLSKGQAGGEEYHLGVALREIVSSSENPRIADEVIAIAPITNHDDVTFSKLVKDDYFNWNSGDELKDS